MRIKFLSSSATADNTTKIILPTAVLVSIFSDNDEVDAQLLELVQNAKQMGGGSCKPIETRADHEVEYPGIAHQAIEPGTAVLGAGDAFVTILGFVRDSWWKSSCKAHRRSVGRAWC